MARARKQPRGAALAIATAALGLGIAVALGALILSPGDERSDRGKPPAATNVFPRSLWRRAVPASARLDPSSRALVAHLGRLVEADRAAHRGPWIDTSRCAPPIYRVPADQPVQRVALENGSSKANASLQAAFTRVPLPDDPRTSRCSDASLLLWQPATDRYWEFWKLTKARDGWHAAWGGATQHASRNPGYFNHADWPGAESYWGASATSLTLAGGLLSVEDLRRGRIDHALQLSLPKTRSGQWSWPAQRTDQAPGDTAADSIPAGAHFRLDPSLDVGSLDVPPMTRMIAEAAQRYGIVITDRTNWMVGLGAESSLTAAQRGGEDPYARHLDGKRPNEILDAFPWDRLQLLEMKLSPAPG